MKRMKQTLAMLLACLLVFSSIPLQGHAEEPSAKGTPSEDTTYDVPPFVTDELPIGEVTTLRTEDTKTFYKGNGKYNKRYYFQPVHKKQKGKWTDISASLIDAADGSSETTENALLTSSFQKHMKNGQYATFDLNGESISYSLLTASGDKEAMQTTDNKAVYRKKENKILYNEVFPGIDLRNLTFEQTIKEDLVLNSYQGYYSFTFHLKTSLLAEKQEDG